MRAHAVACLAIASAIPATAQTAPCGRNIVLVGGSEQEERFIPASPEHVKASVLRALPIVGAKPHKEDRLTLEAKTDAEMLRSVNQRNKDAGVGGLIRNGTGAMGSFRISMQPASENNVAGTRLRIEFSKNTMKGRMGSSKQATPLIDEVACLAGLLLPGDPVKTPRGPEAEPAPAELRAVTVPEGTPVKLLLRSYLYSREIKKQKTPGPIAFEVAEDVTVKGATVIRRGALGMGRFTSAKGARGRGKSAELQFAIDQVTAVDGQVVKLLGAMDASRGSRRDDPMAKYSGLVGFAITGAETVVRAGTGYQAQVAANQEIKTGNWR